MDRYSILFSDNHIDAIIEKEDAFLNMMYSASRVSARYKNMLASFISKERVNNKRYIHAKAIHIIKQMKQNKIAMMYIPNINK